MKFCGNCGKQINDTASFCPYCGARVQKPDTQRSTFNNSQRQPYQAPKTKQQQKHPDEEKQYGGRKSDSTTLFIIAAVVIALIIGWTVNGSGSKTNKHVASNTNKVTTNSNTNQAKNSNSKNTNNPASITVNGFVTARDFLNVRQGPGENYGVITTLSYGTPVTINESSNGWYKVTFIDTVGWCSAEFIARPKKVNRYGKLINGETNARTGPSTEAYAEILGVFNNGEKVYVIGSYSGWYLVQRPSAGGQLVWTFADFVALQ